VPERQGWNDGQQECFFVSSVWFCDHCCGGEARGQVGPTLHMLCICHAGAVQCCSVAVLLHWIWGKWL